MSDVFNVEDPNVQRWRHQCEDLKAQLAALKQSDQPAKEKLRAIAEQFGIKQSYSGEITINYDQFLKGIGMAEAEKLLGILAQALGQSAPSGATVEDMTAEQALELRNKIDRVHKISGAPGEKPKIRMVAAV